MGRRSRNSAVTVQQFDPGTGWTLLEARELVRTGYTPEHVERLTGWPKAMLIAK